MFTISKTTKSTQAAACTPNILPCRIHHDGLVDASERYWKPEKGADGSLEAYFRGRKLNGRETQVPDKYRGVLVKAAHNANTAENARRGQELEDEDEDIMEVGVMEETGHFEKIIIWGHESKAVDDDTFVKGMEEWISFAEAMNQPARHTPSDPKLSGQRL